MRTKLCEQLAIDHPVIQAPIGGAAGPALAAAVSDAGGLGSLALTEGVGPEPARASASYAGGPSGHLSPTSCSPTTSRRKSRRSWMSGFRWSRSSGGTPGPLAPRVHDTGALLMCTVGSVAEAEHAAEAGVDVIVAQGWEAGGHVRGTTATLVLVPAVVDAVAPLPVVAAGGIADGRGLAAALSLGAEAAWIGARFLSAVEADAHPHYRERLLAAEAADTVYSTLFDGGWPDARRAW